MVCTERPQSEMRRNRTKPNGLWIHNMCTAIYSIRPLGESKLGHLNQFVATMTNNEIIKTPNNKMVSSWASWWGHHEAIKKHLSVSSQSRAQAKSWEKLSKNWDSIQLLGDLPKRLPINVWKWMTEKNIRHRGIHFNKRDLVFYLSHRMFYL